MPKKIKKHIDNRILATYLELAEETEIKEEDRGFILTCLRIGMALTQTELAERVDLSPSTIQVYEAGTRKIPTIIWYGILYYFKKLLEIEKEKEQEQEGSDFLRYL